MMVWQDMVNPNQGLPEGSKQEFEKESAEIVTQLYNYPSITTWVLFNEKWGQYDQERLTKWLKQVDPSRLVNGHSGEYLYVNGKLRSESPNAYVDADMTDVHSYPNPMMPEKYQGKAWVCGEFGGIGLPIPDHQWNDLTGWGYVQVTPKELDSKYNEMVRQLKELEKQGLSASIYTQPFDVEGEENGLMTYDRDIIKIPVNRLREIHSQLIDLTLNKIDKKFFVAQNMDLADNDSRYAEFQELFEKGNRDSTLLRKLVLLAYHKKDTLNTKKYTQFYVESLKNPYAPGNLFLLKQLTKSTSDPGFKVFFNNIERANAVLGKDEAEALLTRFIERDYILPKLENIQYPNWEKINADVTSFGDIGREIYLQARFLFAINNSLWSDFADIGKTWFGKYGNKRKWISDGMRNGIGWRVFTKSEDAKALGTALFICAKNIESADENMLDTYANLLYKLGKKEEAIEWEKKALNKAPENKAIQENYKKMKNGIPTWDVTKQVN